ncbi:hypothetical protein MMYC01_207969 [Madurella mycetomatis]|uniref:Uncharacterized protein n=1 Tax=Madurella mycetomatis TaxID=100816 RepID=A0A175VTR9_9PEZI|nr:hypothetical protein MMYC01_207969 [Madurella mycetomatis]
MDNEITGLADSVFDELVLWPNFGVCSKYSEEECLLAVRGERIPSSIVNSPCVTQLCVLRGIRHHPGIAAEVRGVPNLPDEFRRALNARDIMSNELPDMIDPNYIPYCIWYPDWLSQVDTNETEPKQYQHLKRAINARFIMTNDLSRITPETNAFDLPYQIWYPIQARPETYLELARRNKHALYAVARALMVCDYEQTWDGLGDFEPSSELMIEVEDCRNTHYLEDLRRRCRERGVDCSGALDAWKLPDH